MTQLRFEGRVAIVTGAGRGVGRTHALLLANRGAHVVVVDHGGNIDGGGSSAGPADEVVGEIVAAGGQAIACHASVADEASAAVIVDNALQTYGRVDIVMNNAGIHDPGLFEDLSAQQFRRMLDVHYLGTAFVTRAAWPHLKQQGYGRVVNTVSEAMLGGIPTLTSYGAAKGAVFSLTRNLATEGRAHGIGVNAIAPRAYTRLSASASDERASELSLSQQQMDAIHASMPPELCSPAAAFLAHESCVLSGEVLQVGMGSVSRIAVLYSQGISKADLTVEDVADSLDAIMDMSDGRITDTAAIVK
jgi:NAD(P)-dependent dehydrogenase (short-subunit alcohol dehydrogenase family)